MVGHLVHQNRQRSNRTQAQISHKGRGNQHAVAKAVHAVAGQHGPTAADRGLLLGAVLMAVLVRAVLVTLMTVVVFMAVVPQLGLVHQEKKHQTTQQGHEQIGRPNLAFKGLRQQVHEGGGQQGPGGQAQHVLGVAGQGAKNQQSRQPHAANAGNQGAGEDGDEQHLRPPRGF